jgi:hypothetical protein
MHDYSRRDKKLPDDRREGIKRTTFVNIPAAFRRPAQTRRERKQRNRPEPREDSL